MLIDFDAYFQPPPQRKLLSNHEIQALVLHLLRGREIKQVQPLSGGFRNQNYLVELKPDNRAKRVEKVVLRVASDLASARTELALMERLAQFLPVPRILARRETSAHVFSLLEYIEGIVPARLPTDLPTQEYASLGAAIGAVLARIHQVQFEQTGFLAADLSIPDPDANLGDAWMAYMREVLHGKRAETRLGVSGCQELLALLNRYESLLRDLNPVNRLVHSDFNLKNLLVREHEGWWQVRAVLDWEFAHSGSPLVDLGNFFRFESVLPPELFAGFLQAYQEMAGPLPPQWRQAARLLDLASMCNFLDAPEERALTFATARKVIQESLHALS